MLYFLASVILIVAGADPGNLKTAEDDAKKGFELALVYMLEYWWIIAAALVLATIVGIGIWLIKRSLDPTEKAADDLEPMLYLSGRNVKTVRSNIF